MVFGIILKKILPIAVIGIGIFALANIVARPAQAQLTSNALSSTLGGFGQGLGSVGSGIGGLLGGIGSGTASLLDPLFTLKTLIYGDTPQTVEIQNSRTESSTSIQDPTVNTAGPNLSPASQTAVFGGYGSQAGQDQALADLIATNTKLYPEWFN